MKNGFLGFAGGLILVIALDAFLGQRVGLVMFSLGAALPLVGLLGYLCSAKRLRSASQLLARIATGIDAAHAPQALHSQAPQAPVVPSLEAADPEVIDALRRLGAKQKDAEARTLRAMKENPGADTDTVLKAALRVTA